MKLCDSIYNILNMTLNCLWGCTVLWEKLVLFLLILKIICVVELCCRIVCVDIPCVDSLSTCFDQTHGKWAFTEDRIVNFFSSPFSFSKWILPKSIRTVLYNPTVLRSGCHLEPVAERELCVFFTYWKVFLEDYLDVILLMLWVWGARFW